MRNEKVARYQLLVDDLKKMMNQKQRGDEIAKKINDQFWEELSIHHDRLEEQIQTAESLDQEKWKAVQGTSDSIYEAARTFRMKYDAHF